MGIQDGGLDRQPIIFFVSVWLTDVLMIASTGLHAIRSFQLRRRDSYGTGVHWFSHVLSVRGYLFMLGNSPLKYISRNYLLIFNLFIY